MTRIRYFNLVLAGVCASICLVGCGKPDPVPDATQTPTAQTQPALPAGATPGQPGAGTGIVQPGATVPTGDL